MLNCYTQSSTNLIPITPIITEQFPQWLEQQSDTTKNWVKTVNFQAKAETFCLLSDANGKLSQVLLGIRNEKDFWSFGHLSCVLPFAEYQVTQITDAQVLSRIAIAWGSGAYQFTRYKLSDKTLAKLFLPADVNAGHVNNVVTAIHQVRDLINTPTDDMGPTELAQAASDLVKQYNAEIKILVGEELLKNNYPTIYTVGRASAQQPRLIDIRWGDSKAPKITLVGKGVCFDSGGLDLKTSSGMLLMKKDMGGAAHVLGLAKMIMQAQLPVRLRVLIPAVENAVSANAYHPGDIIKTRKGITVEIGNTDAEGRLILCDALAEAATENPELIIDIATLTGAAKVAVGTEISSMFTDNDELANGILKHASDEQDPVWRMPLYAPYRKLLDSPIADINNASTSVFAGSITAALFLKEFVPANIPWVHFDLMAWNVDNRPGRPAGAEAQAIRALFEYLQQRFPQ